MKLSIYVSIDVSMNIFDQSSKLVDLAFHTCRPELFRCPAHAYTGNSRRHPCDTRDSRRSPRARPRFPISNFPPSRRQVISRWTRCVPTSTAQCEEYPVPDSRITGFYSAPWIHSPPPYISSHRFTLDAARVTLLLLHGTMHGNDV